MEPLSYYGHAVPTDVWYDDDEDTVAASKEAASTLPAAAGDCSPRPNYRRPRAFDHDSDMYETEDYRQQKVRPMFRLHRSFITFITLSLF